jgi:L-amino acid N-acyltransferase YncA
MQTNIRPAEAKDLPAILEIVNYNILNSTAVYDYDPKSLADMQVWFDEKQQANWPIVVAEIEGKVAGYASYGPFRFKQGYRFTIEHSVYVNEKHNGKGIGKLLLTELITLAKTKGYHTMIGGIDADNKGSIEFHKKFGFIETGTIKESGFKFDRWLDLTFMQLILE